MHAEPSADLRTPLVADLSYEAFLKKLAPKDRVNAEKHSALCQAGPYPQHVTLWQQLASGLMALAGHSAKLNRHPPSAQFFVADGRYRMQIFAIEDEQSGELRVYCGDSLDQAVKNGVLVVQGSDDDIKAYFVSDSGEPLAIEQLDGGYVNPSPCFRDMVGWNRKAIRIVLPVSASESQLAAVNALCALSVKAG